MSPAERAIWSLGASVLLLFSVVVALGVLGYFANNHRVRDIQHDRVLSCQRTYEGVREVALPLFHSPAQRSPREVRNVEKINKTVDRLKARCASQVGLK